MMSVKNAAFAVMCSALLASSAIAQDAEGEHNDTRRSERKLYAGKNATEANVHFSHYVLYEGPLPSTEAAEEQVSQQVEHLFGPISAARYKAVPRSVHQISNIKIQKIKARNYKITYDYDNTFIIENGVRDAYDLTLPRNPDRIYAQGTVTRGRTATYPCTDHHYQSEGDFWYFWNPKQPGCPLKAGEHYDVVHASFTRLPNTTNTAPEYERLVQDVNGKKTILIDMLMGMNEPDQGRNPHTSQDINADNFREFRQTLLDRGFQSRIWGEDDWNALRAISGKNNRPATFKSTFIEEFTKQNRDATIVLRISFGPSGIDEDSGTFHYLFKNALENSGIMIYDGHSGLGGHLALSSIEDMHSFEITPNSSRYQIYFFDSCSSYTYYNEMYFSRKVSDADPKGTKNLDILANGLSTLFSVMVQSNIALIDAVDLWSQGGRRTTYQQLAAEIDSDNLFSVIGDEDNR